jgi:Fe2+ transport system protein B
MNKDKKIERLEQKLAKAQEEIKQLRSDVRKAKREKSKASKKKRRQDRNADQRTATVTFDAIRRYTYSGFLIKTAFLLCIYAKCSPREAAKCLEVFNFMFEGLLGDSPCHTTIRTWLAKLGLDAIKNKHISIEEAYAIILDASISVGDQ